MCGRFSNKKQLDLSREQGLEVSENLEWRPSYNIAPTQNALVTTADRPSKVEVMHFGPVPFWAKDVKVGFKMINARAETVMEKTSFKPLVTKGKRCLVYATNFDEWKKIGKNKQPYLFQLTDREVFAFAGLWSLWNDPEGGDYYSFSIITTTPNVLTSEVHDRPGNR